MTPAQLRTEIERLIGTLYAARLAIASSPTVIIQAGREKTVSWTNEISISTLFDAGSTFEEYRILLREKWYTAILFDGAILQLSYSFSGKTLKKHRLCYYPCPIRFSPPELEHFSIDELLEALDESELRARIRLEGPLRFDYDLDSGAPAHPASHLTISRSSCRIPVSAPLSVGHFVRFLFSHFYPSHWADSQELQDWSCLTGSACLPEIEDDQLYVHWKRRR